MMKYQKSMLKIYGFLVTNINSSFILEELIEKSGVGRTSGYDAVSWMHKNGLVTIKVRGKQKEIKLNHDYSTLAFKVYLDSIKFKCMDNEIKKTVEGIISYAKAQPIKTMLLEDNPAGMKLTLVSDTLGEGELSEIKKRIKPLSGMQLSFCRRPEEGAFENGICVYGFDHYLSMLSDIIKKGGNE